MNEEWKPCGVSSYQASNFGRIRNSDGKLIALRPNHDGYLRAELYYAPGKKKWFRVNRLVAVAFHSCENPELQTVDHKDANRDNNYAYNLQWTTHRENCRLAAERRKSKRQAIDETGVNT